MHPEGQLLITVVISRDFIAMTMGTSFRNQDPPNKVWQEYLLSLSTLNLLKNFKLGMVEKGYHT